VNQVAWNWKAGTAGSGATQGSGTLKTYTSSYNTAAGFSITKYTGNGTANHKIPHSLSVAPNLVITKQLNSGGWSRGWGVGSIQPAASMSFTYYLILDTAAAKATSASGVWNNIAPTATVFNLGDSISFNYTNESAQDYIAYCWHDVKGYSKIGSYKGNSSSDGTFVYCGFRPAWLLIKPINYGDGWKMWDVVRGPQNGPYNQRGDHWAVGDLKPDTNATENFSTAFNFDFLSNGFKWSGTDGSVNSSSYHYLFIAFAETPFKYATAR
jgi:hypothetical protein